MRMKLLKSGVVLLMLFCALCGNAQNGTADTLYVFSIVNTEETTNGVMPDMVLINRGSTTTDATNHFVLKDIACKIDSAERLQIDEFFKSKFIRKFLRENKYFPFKNAYGSYLVKARLVVADYTTLECIQSTFKRSDRLAVDSTKQTYLRRVYSTKKLKANDPRIIDKLNQLFSVRN
jgi:hypothetical protein